jgi:hypothetical protein
MEYHKINSVFKRDEKTRRFLDEFSTPELEFLKDNLWEFTEKIDGMNTRVMWDGVRVSFGGKTDNAQMPTKLLEKLRLIFTEDKLREVFGLTEKVVLYGEGFGVNIQSGGKYLKDGVDFILFDVLVGDWWLVREAVEDIAKKLDIKVVKVVGEGTLFDAVELAKKGFKSEFGDFVAEGIVLRPKVQLFSRKGERIITKVKYKDFNSVKVK